jgi:YrbI family 3-deoxy-D-manno-octulosonate 8-phosphate phosphatase
MKYLAIIPARGGSKGVPGKNIRSCNGRPLIAWSIEHALECDRIDKIVVSTDADEIAHVARSFGAEVPRLRPAHLATDESKTEPVMMHVLDELRDIGYEPDAVVLLQPTSPYRRPGRLDEAIQRFEAEQADSLLSVGPTAEFFWRDPKAPYPSYDIDNRPRRQEISRQDEWLQETGSIYITKVDLLRQKQNRLGGRISLFQMSALESPQIDTEEDFLILEQLMRIGSHREAKRPWIERDDIDCIIFDFDGVLTNNLVYVSEDGVEMVACNRSDGVASDIFRAKGIPCFIVSTEINPVVSARGAKLKMAVFQGVSNKDDAIGEICRKNGFDQDRVLFVGNDVNDLAAMNSVGYPIAVGDAHATVKDAARFVLNQRGGEGVAREVLEMVLGISADTWRRIVD